MKSIFSLLLLVAGLLGGAACAAEDVRDFNESTWATLLKSGPRPAAYLFTTSYCSTCPEAFATIQTAVRQKHMAVETVAVMMDVDAAQALRHAAHFPGHTQIYAFDGFEPAIRSSVDPHWPNVTPYVVLIDRHGKVRRSIGPPTPSVLRAWLAP